MINNSPIVRSFRDIDKTMHGLVGGKAANLGELCKIDGIKVPGGFCISIEAFQRTIGEIPLINELLDQLSFLKVNEPGNIGKLSAKIRGVIEDTPIPPEIAEEIGRFLSRPGEKNSYAVRSSATAEDLAAASFAGQQDTYLNVVGKKEILRHVSKCWASLYTDRAIIYRLQNGFNHRQVYMSVIVQEMVFPEVSGVLFTADPLTCNRKISSIDASFGLGEAIVLGLVNADCYKVLPGHEIRKKVSTKKLFIKPLKDGGTSLQELEPARHTAQALPDERILLLEQIGRKIETHFGRPQDIEWCLAGDIFYILQSRPITGLYPVPVSGDGGNHVYVSVGHQQMMTDPMRPLGLSLFQLTAGRTMYKGGGRLFVDIIHELASPSSRETIINVLGKSDPLIRDALTIIINRGDFIKSTPGEVKGKGANAPRNFRTLVDYNPEIVQELIGKSEAAITQLRNEIEAKSGTDLIDFILEDIQQLKNNLSNQQSFGVIMTAINASLWINEKMDEWLGEKNAADTLSQSVPNNITSEMGLALLNVADVIRAYPEIIEYLQQAKNDSFPDEMVKFNGGRESRLAINDYLRKYGMRCTGEIDITRTRWSERPLTLVPAILSNIKNLEPGAGNRKFEQGRQNALKKEQELLGRLEQLPGGEQKVKETKRMISLVRNLIGYREYPKYSIVSRYFVYKQALMKEAERLVQAAIIHEKEDIYYLSFEELRELLSRPPDAHSPYYEIISNRKEEFKLYEKLTPPRVITSDGEIISGEYNRHNLPPGALVGLAVSSGLVEGRARVILTMEDADINEGDILVTSFTDPSWTPLFVSIKGLVTEVGGLMTHGAVIAREYGLPAVVGVENATRLIKDGQQIRVHGTEGYVEVI